MIMGGLFSSEWFRWQIVCYFDGLDHWL